MSLGGKPTTGCQSSQSPSRGVRVGCRWERREGRSMGGCAVRRGRPPLVQGGGEGTRERRSTRSANTENSGAARVRSAKLRFSPRCSSLRARSPSVPPSHSPYSSASSDWSRRRDCGIGRARRWGLLGHSRVQYESTRGARRLRYRHSDTPRVYAILNHPRTDAVYIILESKQFASPWLSSFDRSSMRQLLFIHRN